MKDRVPASVVQPKPVRARGTNGRDGSGVVGEEGGQRREGRQEKRKGKRLQSSARTVARLQSLSEEAKC